MHLAGSRGKYPYQNGRHLLTFLYAYGDDSGSEEDARFCIVSGYIGSPRQWDSFEKAWAAILDTYQVPEFHSKDFFPLQRRGHVAPFKDWSAAKASEFLGELLGILDRHRRIAPIGRAINVKDFQALPYDDRRLLTGGSILLHNRVNRRRLDAKWKAHGAPSRPYLLAFQYFLVDALTAAKDGVGIHFVFDTQNALEARATETFREFIVEQSGASLESITFTDSKLKAGLQAADMHAYLWHRWLTERPLTKDMTTAMTRICKKKETMGILDAESFAAVRPLLFEQVRTTIVTRVERS